MRKILILESLLPGDKSVELEQSEVPLEEAIEEIDKLNYGKGKGLDGIYPRILKELSLKIANLQNCKSTNLFPKNSHCARELESSQCNDNL